MTDLSSSDEQRRLRFVLATLVLVAAWIITNSFFKTGWITAAILAFGVLIIDIIYIIRTKDQLLGKFLFFGLAAGFVELLADAWLVARTKTLFYEQGDPLLLDSPVYMPVAWAIILVQIGYIGYYFYLRRGLLFATIVTGLIGGAIIPIYEYSAKGAGWWAYEDLHRMFLNATPYYIILGEFLLALALPGFFILCQRKQFYWTLPLGAAMGIWIWIAYIISFQLVG